MPTNILRPLAEGTFTGHALIAGASKMAAVNCADGVTHDDATSYIQGAGGSYQSFTLTNKPPVGGAVTGVTAGARWGALSGAPTAGGFMRLGTTDAYWISGRTAAAWATATAAAPRPGGGNWTMADIRSATCEMGVGVTAGGGGDIWGTTSMWVSVAWVPVGGGLITALELGSLAALVLPTLAGLAQFARSYAQEHDIRWHPGEVEQLWREYRECRRPRFCFVGA